MTYSRKLWSFKTKNFEVTLHCEPERYPDFSFDDTGETQEKVAAGEWECVVFIVTVHWRGREIGCDTLGNSIYADVRDFRREHVGAGARSGSYFRDMIREAVREARQELLRMQRDFPHVRAA